jgi:hypothetical protein
MPEVTAVLTDELEEHRRTSFLLKHLAILRYFSNSGTYLRAYPRPTGLCH